jgi:hypothetical protein
MAKNKAADRSGMVAEMLHAGSQTLREVIAAMFTKVMRCEWPPPAAWKVSFVSVLFKKGDPKLPGNYRPITLLPILYKLFTRVLYLRIGSVLDAAQPVDQAGFRSGYSCDDHLLAIMLIIDSFSEHRLPLWICAIDFEKAFDTVEHAFLWQSLAEQGVAPQYVCLLAAMYEDQSGHVCGGTMSRSFILARGTKQGDPLSPALFNAALECVMGRLQTKWVKKGWGIPVENEFGRRLTNLRFADDILLLAVSKRQLCGMLEDLAHEATAAGLQIHFGKTTILSNSPDNKGGKHKLKCGEIEILPFSGSVAYLGRTLSCDDQHDTEIAARVGKAWKSSLL